MSLKKTLRKLLKPKNDEKSREAKATNDVIIYVGEEPDFKEFHANSKTLRSKSDHFKKILSAKDIEKKDGKYIIKKPNITPQVFDVIIKHLSTGQFNAINDYQTILNVMIVSDDFKLNKLIKLAENAFINNCQQFLRNDPVKILQIVHYHQILNNVRNVCLETICFAPGILFDSAKFTDLPAPILEDILKRDNLSLAEIKVWDNLIKWGLAQEKSLNEDVSKWRQEDFNIFERILHKFIPLIRFCCILSEDYFNKVRPYERIFSKELREEILKFHMVPKYKLTIDPLRQRCPKSVLIGQEHNALSNYIDRKKDEEKEKNKF